jgi:prephenate dehydrogenase
MGGFFNAMKKVKQNKLKIGVIGLGRFGSLLTKNLIRSMPETKVLGFDISTCINIKNVEIVTLEEISSCDVIFVCVPISKFQKLIKDLRDTLKPGTIVLDVCSVKVFPSQIMLKLLPNTVFCFATHPLFGPLSASRGIKGNKIVVCPLRTSKKSREVTDFIFAKLHLEVVKMDPETHDKMMAFSQGFTHLIGRIGNKIGVTETLVDTKSFKQLLDVQEIVLSDSEELFIDMQKFNPFTKRMRQSVKRALNDIEKNILLQ